MVDPIEYAFRAFFGIFDGASEEMRPFWFVMQVFGFLLIIRLFKKNFLGSDERREEKAWADICGMILDRISYLTPIYEEHLLAFAKSYAHGIAENKNFTALSQSLSDEAKERAEHDFCVRIVHRDEQVALLHEQLETLLKGDGHG